MHCTPESRDHEKDNQSRIGEILSRIRLSDVCRALTGHDPHHGRIPAPWRDTRDRNVSLSDDKGTYFDHVEGVGGGILDFVSRIRGGDKADALRWLAGMAGVKLEDKPLSPEDREQWARERRDLERDLPAARYWRAAAVDMAEDLLGVLKAGVFDPASPLEVGRITWEISGIEGMLSRLKRLDGAGLVAEYRDWLGVYPAIVAGMVAAARRLERARRAALLAYLGFGEPKGKAA